jgi:hypothetical protein
MPLATANSTSFTGTISGDGRYVAFFTDASDIVAGMTGGGGRNVVLYDRVTDSNVLVSHAASSTTASGDGGSNDPNISHDGNFIVFQSAADNLIAGGTDANSQNDVFVYDRQMTTNVLVSHTYNSATTAGNYTSYLAIPQNANTPNFISADGRYVVYQSAAQDLVSGFIDGNGLDTTGVFDTDVFMFDRALGTNTLISRTPASPVTSGNNGSQFPTVSSDGRFVAFFTGATNLVTGFALSTTTNIYNICVYDRVLTTTTLVSHASNSSTVGSNYVPYGLTINADGSLIGYTSDASNLVMGDLNNFTDVFGYVTTPPQVAAPQINDGSVQRSMVRSITVTFDEPVFFSGDPAAAFTLTRNGSVGSVQLAVASYANNPNGLVTLNFSGPLTEFGSLIDGQYSLTIDASQVKNIANLDGTGAGVAGVNWVSPPGTIFRLFGDANGDGTVSASDFILFRMNFGGNADMFDFDGDGSVSASDFVQFRLRFGGSI